jgi:hypothetical protein
MSSPFKHVVINGNGQALHITRGPQLATVTKVTATKTVSQTLQIPRSIK